MEQRPLYLLAKIATVGFFNLHIPLNFFFHQYFFSGFFYESSFLLLKANCSSVGSARRHIAWGSYVVTRHEERGNSEFWSIRNGLGAGAEGLMRNRRGASGERIKQRCRFRERNENMQSQDWRKIVEFRRADLTAVDVRSIDGQCKGRVWCIYGRSYYLYWSKALSIFFSLLV